MFQNILTWIRGNKLLVVAIVVIAYLLSNRSSIRPLSYSNRSYEGMAPAQSSIDLGMPSLSMSKRAVEGYDTSPQPESVAPGNPRMVSRDASMSIVVSKVAETQAQMIMVAEKAGGFMVNASVSTPEESATGSFTVRVPSDKLTEVIATYRKMGVKVVSEQINGIDITDQYTDTQARLALLRDTYTQFDQLRREAGTIEEKMNLLSQLQNLQNQIDSLVGQQKYLENTSETSRLSVYLSADEYDLPYAPNDSWRPEVIFKQSVRNLVTTLRGLGTWLIGMAVYSVIWLPLLLIGIFLYRRFYKK